MSRRFRCAIRIRTDRTEPLMFSPVDPHVLYFASNVLFETTDGGNSWRTIRPDLTRENPGVPASVGAMIPKGAEKLRGVIYALAPSFKNLNILWAGTDDGQIWSTRDGGKNWSNITPPELTAWSKVTQISASHLTTRLRTRRSAASALTTFILISIARMMAARAGSRLLPACRSSARSTPCVRIQSVRDCCSRAPKMQSGFHSMTATTGSRCN